jgi:hypothetical protein
MRLKIGLPYQQTSVPCGWLDNLRCCACDARKRHQNPQGPRQRPSHGLTTQPGISIIYLKVIGPKDHPLAVSQPCAAPRPSVRPRPEALGYGHNGSSSKAKHLPQTAVALAPQVNAPLGED